MAKILKNDLHHGRITYQLMVPFWPDVAKSHSMPKGGIEFAETFDSLDKVVFSRSLDSAELEIVRDSCFYHPSGPKKLKKC